MKQHTPRSAGLAITSSFEGFPVLVAPHFDGASDTYDDIQKTHGIWLKEAMLRARLENYVIDYIELHETFILVHHRRPHGSFIPQRPALVFQYKYEYRTRTFHEGEHRHPAGDCCVAWRDNGKLYLEFVNETLELENHFLRGIEGGLFGDSVEDMKDQEDEQFLAHVKKATGEEAVARTEA